MICGKAVFEYILKERLKSTVKWRLTEVEKHLLREEECQKEASFAVQREEVSAEWNDKHKGGGRFLDNVKLQQDFSGGKTKTKKRVDRI